MLKKNHISWTFAISLWLYFYYFKFNLIQTIAFSIVTATLSSLPDMDLKIINHLNQIKGISRIILSPFIWFIKLLFKHRTTTHSLFIPIILFVFTKIYNITGEIYFLILIICVALSLHILEDAFTVAGVRAFYPLPFNFRFAKFSTQSTKDLIILEGMAYLAILSFGYIHWLT